MCLLPTTKRFLNRVCSAIWEIEDGNVSVYEGNYDAYLAEKKKRVLKQEKEHQAYVQEKKRLKQAAKKLQARSDAIKKAPSRMGNSEARLHKRSSGKQKAKLNRAAEAMVTRANKLEHQEKPKEQQQVMFDVTQFPAIHSKRVIQVKDVCLQIEGNVLKQRVNGIVRNGSRMAITGKNGSGKSTFLEVLYEGKEISIAQPAKMGFFRQQQEDLDNDKTILENVQIGSPYDQTFIRTILSRLAFKGDAVHKSVSSLSGGERVRTSLAKVFLGNYNVLVLDEPTNYLDLDTKEALTTVLRAYPGTIVFVTHDRALIDDLATDLLSFDEEEPFLHPFNKTDDVEKVRDNEEELLLATEMKLTETLGKLSIVVDETEKQQLEQLFQELLAQKKQLKK
ncbi:ATP-binding cassette domain-containing protein [Bacillus sp. JCM 19041]|uniref:ATP-binding cassette domain-containing protein n=1 Tax=Bacillus sp. JCM 19041 TaxID=1460637 RepID=UPI00336AC1DE